MLFEQPVGVDAGGITYHASEEIMVDGVLPLSVTTEDVPFDAAPGDDVPYSLTVQAEPFEGGIGNPQFDLQTENTCTAANLSNGYRLLVQVYVSGRAVEEVEWCLPYGSWSFGSPPPRDLDITLPLPETPGTYEIEARITGANTGTYFGSVTDTIDVTTAAGGGGDDGGDGGGDGGGDDGGDGGGFDPCPDGFVRDPETGECVEVGNYDPGDDDNNQNEPPSGCTLADAINPADPCTLADATGALQLAGAGAVLMLFLIVLLAVGE
jgi:hypothetical protein